MRDEMRSEDLQTKTVKDLLVIATELQVVGRHDMKKAELITNIMLKHGTAKVADIVERGAKRVIRKEDSAEFAELLEELEAEEVAISAFEKALVTKIDTKTTPEASASDKKRYERTATVGTIVAFYVNSESLFSGKIMEIHKEKFAIQTKNGNKFLVSKSDVAWYKTGKRWPSGVYNELTRRNKVAGA